VPSPFARPRAPVLASPTATEPLNDEQTAYVVQRLALFDSPMTIANAMQEEFGVVLTRLSLEHYDPNSFAGRALATRWAELFRQTRAALLENPAAIGIANKAVRLRWLHGIAERALEQGSHGDARAAIEQAAKEMGESYSKQKHEHPGPGLLSDAELDARIAAKAAELGLAPAGAGRAGTPHRGADAAEEPQPAEEPLSG
jgi:hypothetical protein